MSAHPKRWWLSPAAIRKVNRKHRAKWRRRARAAGATTEDKRARRLFRSKCREAMKPGKVAT